jgi:hypothetical protein
MSTANHLGCSDAPRAVFRIQFNPGFVGDLIPLLRKIKQLILR